MSRNGQLNGNNGTIVHVPTQFLSTQAASYFTIIFNQNQSNKDFASLNWKNQKNESLFSIIR